MSPKISGGSSSFDPSIPLLMLIILLLAGGIAFGLVYLRQDPIDEALAGDRVVNTLFVIEDRGKPLASYVFLYYPQTAKAAIFDIPGEVGLILQGIDRVDRIDTIYDQRKIEIFTDEVESLLGIDINFYVILTVEQLSRVVDLIEGVEIFTPSPVAVYEPGQMVFFPSGLTRLDGDKARSYITYRLSDGVTDQVNFRRQRFFLGFIKRLGEQNHVLRNTAVSRQFQSMLTTNMTQRSQIRFFNEFAKLDTERMNIQSVGGNIREVSGQVLLFPYYEGSLIKEIVRQALSSLIRRLEGSFSDRVYTVEVLNGTGITGLAGRTAELLRSFGYDVISVGNADRSDFDSTEIIDRSGSEEVAKTFADVIRCDNIRPEVLPSDDYEPEIGIIIQNLEYKADFTLIIGKDFNGRYVSGG
ncbi:MAG: LCP family protein [Treponema sp.]|nr:LCP family protein [Treponema sp.]